MRTDSTFEKAMAKVSVWALVLELRNNMDYKMASMRWPGLERNILEIELIIKSTLREYMNGNIS